MCRPELVFVPSATLLSEGVLFLPFPFYLKEKKITLFFRFLLCPCLSWSSIRDQVNLVLESPASIITTQDLCSCSYYLFQTLAFAFLLVHKIYKTIRAFQDTEWSRDPSNWTHVLDTRPVILFSLSLYSLFPSLIGGTSAEFDVVSSIVRRDLSPEGVWMSMDPCLQGRLRWIGWLPLLLQNSVLLRHKTEVVFLSWPQDAGWSHHPFFILTDGEDLPPQKKIL